MSLTNKFFNYQLALHALSIAKAVYLLDEVTVFFC